MGRGPGDGVTDHLGRVFGADGVIVADGALLPEALGINPSRTISALAERIAEHLTGRPGTAPDHQPALPPLPPPP
jgi:cholesterol oxidase